MDKQMIEEMAQCKNFNGYTCKSCGVKYACDRYILAEELYNAGYRKIPENAVVLDKAEYDELQKGIKTYNYTAMFDAQSAYRWEQGYLQGTKKTAEKFAERLKEKADMNLCLFGSHIVFVGEIDEIAKEFTEGKV